MMPNSTTHSIWDRTIVRKINFSHECKGCHLDECQFCRASMLWLVLTLLLSSIPVPFLEPVHCYLISFQIPNSQNSIFTPAVPSKCQCKLYNTHVLNEVSLCILEKLNREERRDKKNGEKKVILGTEETEKGKKNSSTCEELSLLRVSNHSPYFPVARQLDLLKTKKNPIQYVVFVMHFEVHQGSTC